MTSSAGENSQSTGVKPAAKSSSAGDSGQSMGVTSAATSSSAGDSGQSAGCSSQLMGKRSLSSSIPITAFSPEHIHPQQKAEARPRPEMESGGIHCNFDGYSQKKDFGAEAEKFKE